MSQLQTGNSNRDLSDAFQEILQLIARGLLAISVLCTFGAAGFLIYTCVATATGNAALDKQAMNNVLMLQNVLFAGVTGLAVSTTYLFWGEQVLAALQIIFAAGLFTAPIWIPSVTGNATPTAAGTAAMAALQTGGTILGVIAIAGLAIDLGLKARERVTVGTKADQMKYGKGIKEEKDRQNVFLGKCWQLPYCRKFVRERCPIYHSKRTCWKELVGCMCEEEVIRNAMENKPIPKDALLAGNMIPRNNRLTIAQKQTRCKTCVIYNEHQRHKYRAWLPAVLLIHVIVYVLGHSFFVGMMEGLVMRTSSEVNGLTLGASAKNAAAPTFFAELLVVVLFTVSLSYFLKVLDYVIFNLKV